MLGDDEFVIYTDEKTSIQFRGRCHPTLPPGQALLIPVEHECDGGGTLAYFAAYDGDRAGVWCPSSAVWSRWRLELESS